MGRGGVEGDGGGGLWYDAKEFDINPIRVILISRFLLFQVPQNVCRLSGKCVKGVQGV